MLNYRCKSLGIAATLVFVASAATVPVFAEEQMSAASKQTALATRLDDGAGAYKTGRYANLFVERLNKTPAETHERIERAFQTFFHGDGQEERIYFETGANEN
ncbi:MAG: hypothetical protein EOO68_17065, partial [Moraxellaceae bacterium]